MKLSEMKGANVPFFSEQAQKAIFKEMEKYVMKNFKVPYIPAWKCSHLGGTEK